MSSVITTAGRTLMNQLAGNELPLVIDRMVLAMVPGLDTSAAADPDQQLPDAQYIVHTYDIPEDYKGYVNADQVVYSMMLGSDIGEFSFNWIGLLEANTDTVITVTVTPESSKWATDLATNTTGNMVTRNVILSYQDAQNLTGITVSAETWQFDYQGDLNTHITLKVDPTSDDDTVLKHLTNAQLKVCYDHINDDELHGQHSDPYAVFWDQKASGTSGGACLASTVHVRDLNQEYNPNGIGYLDSNQIKAVPAGTYYIRFSCPGNECNAHRAYIYNVTTSEVLLYGHNARSGALNTNVTTHSFGSGVVTLPVDSDLELRQWTLEARSSGLGLSAYDGAPEKYSKVEIFKRAE